MTFEKGARPLCLSGETSITAPKGGVVGVRPTGDTIAGSQSDQAGSYPALIVGCNSLSRLQLLLFRKEEGMIVRVRAQDEKLNEVIDVLRPLGVEVTTGEESPLESALFYISRMNSKLDNLGQLRHLHKFLLQVTDIKQNLKTISLYFYEKNEEQHAQYRLRELLYAQLVERTGKKPALSTPVRFLSEEQIRELFT